MSSRLLELSLSSSRPDSLFSNYSVYYDFPSLIPLNKELHEISSRINALRPDDYRSIHSTNHMAVARRYKALLDKGEEDVEFEEDERELREFVTDKRELKECVQRVCRRSLVSSRRNDRNENLDEKRLT